MNYPYYYPQDQLSVLRQPYIQQPPADERIWVQGEAGANAYLVASNGFVRLWDAQAPVFYEKRADATGRPSMDIYEYTKRGSQKPQIDNFNNDTNNLLDEQIKALEKRICALEEKKNVKRKPNADDTEV